MSQKKQTFGVIVTTRSFFPSHLVASARAAIFKKLDALGYGYIAVGEQDTNYGAVLSYEEAKTCANLFRAHRDEICGIIVILPNFGEETGVTDAIDLADLNVPVLIQACNDDFNNLAMANRRDSFCGKLSLCNNLYQRGIKYTNTSRHTCKIESDVFTDDLKRFAAVCRVVAGLKHSRFAQIGARVAPFHTVRYSEKILQQHGIGVQSTDMSEIIAKATNMPTDERVQAKIDEIKAYGRIIPGISEEKVIKEAKLALALEDCVDANACVGSAIACWDSVEQNYGCATCLAMSMMGEKGKPSACETDIVGAVTMYALQLAAEGEKPALLDWNNNVDDESDKCIGFHCSNYPKSFIRKDDVEIGTLDVLSTTIGEDLCFGAYKAQVAGGPMTYARLSTDDAKGTLKMYVGEGQFLDDPIDTKGGTAYCEVKNLQGLMNYMCMNGFEHHVAMIRGNVADVLEEALGKYVGVEVYRHN